MDFWDEGMPDRDRKWMIKAACDGADPTLFYEDRLGHATRVDEAKAMCGACPVRVRCLEMALDNNEKFGIWGGLLPLERRALARQRKKDGR